MSCLPRKNVVSVSSISLQFKLDMEMSCIPRKNVIFVSENNLFSKNMIQMSLDLRLDSTRFSQFFIHHFVQGSSMRFPSDTLLEFTCCEAGIPLYREIKDFFNSPAAVIHFLLNRGILKEAPICPACNDHMTFKCSIYQRNTTPLRFKDKEDIRLRFSAAYV